MFAFMRGIALAGAAVFSLVAALLHSALPVAAQELSGPARVIDGDTISISGQIIDLFGIDAPELDFNGIEQTCLNNGQSYRCALVAAGMLADKLAGRAISCEPQFVDAEGRMQASCYMKNGEDLGGWLVNKGFVVVDSRHSDEFSDWEAWNKAAGTGLWAGPFELPWLWRERNK